MTTPAPSSVQHSLPSPLRVEHVGFAPGFVDFAEAWDLQRQVHAQVVAGALPDTVLLLEHDPVYTAGRRTEPFERPFDGTAVVDVDRGGKITWHGPGQLVGYPIVRLPSPLAVVDHVRRIEQMLMDVCTDLGVKTMRLLTNNPRKFVGLQGYGLAVSATVPLEVPVGEHTRKYLKTKKDKLGHKLSSV